MKNKVPHGPLSLQLVRLKSPAEWTLKKEGLAFVFPNAGCGKYFVGPVARRLAPGDVLVSEACKGVKLSASDSAALVFSCFLIRIEHLFPLFGAQEVSFLRAVVQGLGRPKAFPASGSLAKQCHQLLSGLSTDYNLEHRSQLLRVAYRILAEEFKTAQQERVRSIRTQDEMIQVLANVRRDELPPTLITALAVRFGCTQRHLNRLFHQHLGISVSALRMQLRLMKALSLLRDPHAKVLTVAEQCSFHHLGLFTACFKRRFRITPGRWRDKVSQVETGPPSHANIPQACILLRCRLCPRENNSPASCGQAPSEVPQSVPGS